MAKIRDALNSLPARPALAAAVILAAGVAVLHYGKQYQRCVGHADLRAALHGAVESAIDGTTREVRLADVAPFAWDHVDIQENFRPQVAPDDCAFGWDWSNEERQALIDDGLLTVIVFSRDGALVDYLEYRADWGGFEGIVGPLPRERAVFTATRNGDAIVLRLADG